MPDDVLELARALVARPSVTPQDCGCQDLIGERLAKLDFVLEPMPFGDVSNLWARRGNADPLAVFAGHTDVVPPGPTEAWRHDPFDPIVVDGYLYGRGTADMKSSLAAFVISAERFIAAHPGHPGSIAVLLTSDEEGPARDGTVRVVETLTARDERMEYCLVGEPSSERALGDTIKNGRRGSLHGVLRVAGTQGHVAYPHLADNPIHRFAPALAELSSTRWDEGNAHFPPTTFQVSNLNSGSGVSNVIPGQLEAAFNFRFSTASDPASLQARVEQILKRHELRYRLDWSLSGEPFLTSTGKLVEVAQQAVREELGVMPSLSTAGGTSDGRFIAPTGAQVIELGPVNETIHRVNECIRVQDLDRLSRVYYRILRYLLN